MPELHVAPSRNQLTVRLSGLRSCWVWRASVRAFSRDGDGRGWRAVVVRSSHGLMRSGQRRSESARLSSALPAKSHREGLPEIGLLRSAAVAGCLAFCLWLREHHRKHGQWLVRTTVGAK